MRFARPSSSRPHDAGTALAWSLGNAVVSKLGPMVIGIALARLLGPEEFGTYAVAWVAMLAVLAFNDLGVGLAVVRWDEEPEVIAPTINTVCVASSVVLAAAMAVAAGPFASAMNNPAAAPLVRMLAICVLINGLVSTPAAVLQRAFRQDQRMVVDQVNMWVGALVSIGLAVVGAGAASLVVGRLAGAGLSALLFLRYSPVPYRFGWDVRLWRRLLRFGLPLAGTSVLVFLLGFTDQLVVGKLSGSTALGAYLLAFNLASWPVQLLSQPLRSVAPAMFARLRTQPGVMHERFQQLTRPLAAAALPGCVGIAAAAPEITRLVYGSAWDAAAGPLRWLALFAALRIFFELAYDFLVVTGSSSSLLQVQLLWLVVLVPALVLGVDRWGIAGAAVSQVVVSAVVVTPAYCFLLHRLGIGLLVVVRGLGLPLVAAAGLWVAVQPVLAGTWPLLGRLLLAGGMTAGVVLALLYLRRSDLTALRDRGGDREDRRLPAHP